MSTKHTITAAALVVAAGLVPPAGASVLWDGDASRGTGVFKTITSDGNCGSGSITATTDPTHGRIWRYHKPSGSNRCENHGIRGVTFQNGRTYYLGWRSRLTTTANNNANFQWKSYGSHIQNYPLILKMIGGRMHLQQRQPGASLVTIWSRPISANQWNQYILGLHLSTATRGGWIEFYFNGARQTFTNGTTRYMCRTFDSGNHNCPKWGVYGGSGTTMTNFIDGLRVGTTLADVD